MLEVIIAVDENDGIGKEGKLPWNLPEELALFKYKTMDSVLIVGRKTSENLPPLYNREIITISRVGLNNTIERAIMNARESKKRTIFIAGGAELYNEIFQNHLHLVSKIHVSFINGIHNCDTFVDHIPFFGFDCVSHQKFKDFIHEVYVKKYPSGEMQYIKLLNDVLLSNNYTYGRNGRVISQFGKTLSFNLSNEFPLLTTKKMFLRGIVEELLFFLRGQTDSKILEKKGVNIWKANTKCRDGLMGPMYGSQWRHFNANLDDFDVETSVYKGGYDQLENVINLIKTDPKSRRILMTTFNPAQADKGVLYPCHSIVNQFYVDGQYLDMTCYNRSSDLFLGLPFNITSSALLLHIIAKITGYKPRMFHLYLGDCHIYDSHIVAVQTQLQRIPKSPPQIELKDFKSLEELTFDHFQLKGYNSFDAIKAEMIE